MKDNSTQSLDYYQDNCLGMPPENFDKAITLLNRLLTKVASGATIPTAYRHDLVNLTMFIHTLNSSALYGLIELSNNPVEQLSVLNSNIAHAMALLTRLSIIEMGKKYGTSNPYLTIDQDKPGINLMVK